MSFDLTARLRLIDEMSGPLRRIEGSFGAITRAAGLVGGAISAAFVVGDSVKQAVDFQAKMSAVQAVAQMTKSEMNQLSDAALQMGTKGVYSATEIADGMQSLAASGMNASQIMQAIPNIINAATASGEKFDSVAEIMQATMHAFGLHASDMGKIGDIMAQAANDSAVSIGDMGYTLKYAGPIADKAGQSLQSVAAAAAILGNSGIKADQAGTTLRAGLLRLATEPKRVKDALAQLGISVTDSKGNFLQMGQMIDLLHKKFEGLSQSQKLKMAGYIFGTESSSGWVTLIDKADQYGKELDRINNSTGAASEMAKTKTDNVAGALKKLQGAWKTLQINMGDLVLPSLAQWAQEGSDAISKVTDSFKSGSLSTVVTGISNIFHNLKSDISSIATPLKSAFSDSGIQDFGNWLINNGSLVTSIIEGIGIALGIVAGAMAVTAIAVAVIESPIYLVALAVGVLIGLVIELVKHWDEVKLQAQLLGEKLAIAFTQIEIKALEMGQSIVKALRPVADVLPGFVTKGFNAMAAGIDSSLTDARAQLDSLTAKANSTKDAIDALTGSPHTISFNVDYQTKTFDNNSLMLQPSMIMNAGKNPLGSIGHRANGGLVSSPEISLIGEAGPEYVVPLSNPSRGREVLAQAGAALGVGSGNNPVTINMNGVTIREEADIQRIATALAQEIRLAGGNMT